MENELTRFAGLLRAAYEKGAWHGPAIQEVLSDITSDKSLLRLPHSHSIVELVAHMTAWRIFVLKKLQGDMEYRVPDELNFPTQRTWSAARADLDRSQVELVQAVEALDPAKLDLIIPQGSSSYALYTLLQGIIHHDLYHLGQIVLIKKQTL